MGYMAESGPLDQFSIDKPIGYIHCVHVWKLLKKIKAHELRPAKNYASK